MSHFSAKDVVSAVNEALSDNYKKGRKAMSFDKDDILDAIGLQRNTTMSWLGPAAVGFGVGALIGGVVAMMMAPKAGTELREDLLERGRKIVQRTKDDEFGTTTGMGTRPTT